MFDEGNMSKLSPKVMLLRAEFTSRVLAMPQFDTEEEMLAWIGSLPGLVEWVADHWRSKGAIKKRAVDGVWHGFTTTPSEPKVNEIKGMAGRPVRFNPDLVRDVLSTGGGQMTYSAFMGSLMNFGMSRRTACRMRSEAVNKGEIEWTGDLVRLLTPAQTNSGPDGSAQNAPRGTISGDGAAKVQA
jgi:hypothetical protein